MIKPDLCRLLFQLFHADIGNRSDFTVQKGAYGVSDELHVLQINSRFGFVKENEMRLLRHELQQFRTLYFTTGKPGVDVAIKKRIEIYGFGQAFDIHLMPLAAKMDQMLGFESVNSGWTLEGHAQTETRTFVDGHMGNIVVAEPDFAFGGYHNCQNPSKTSAVWSYLSRWARKV